MLGAVSFGILFGKIYRRRRCTGADGSAYGASANADDCADADCADAVGRAGFKRNDDAGTNRNYRQHFAGANGIGGAGAYQYQHCYRH